MKLQLLLAGVFGVAALGSTAVASAADAMPWELRVGVVELTPANKSDPVGGTGASDRIHVDSKAIPDFDISYFWTPNIANELLLTVPQKQTVSLDGNNIGSFKHLPPTLLIQYHFIPNDTVRPYVGAGINYTRISSVNLANGTLQLDKSSWGPALQAGIDIKVAPSLFLNFDFKYIQIRSDVKSAGAKVSAVKVDPTLAGVRLGWRF